SQMDPQQRLLLEVGYTALEHAGLSPAALRGSATGIYVGLAPSGYGGGGDLSYAVQGSDTAFASGRLAYHLGLRGPALAVNTACSSSLVAIQLAMEGLRAGACDVALAGGASVIVGSASFVALSALQAVAPNGRSKTFSDNADGYGRGEGVGLVTLMRLSDAQVVGHHIYGVLRGAAVQHDGASSGLTVPSGTSQQEVLRRALSDAGVSAEEVDWVECHGTGTSLGDPIEVNALGAVFGGRTEPLGLGAVKSTVGHLEAAAGMAGLFKVLAALRRDTVPPTLHTTPRNLHIDWSAHPVSVQDAPWSWPRSERVRRAGLSAFGLSGTNAHLIVEEAPAVVVAPSASEAQAGPDVVPLLVSGKTVEGLRAQAAKLAAYLLEQPEVSLRDVAYSLATTRSPLAERLAVPVSVDGPVDVVATALSTFAESGVAPHLGTVSTSRDGAVGMWFTG
ncbi:MAG: beta-ketoacyl synthase N-terminal-like domain-containing protein, partial [Actinomycetota bacterium]|nr:beta-ketoacyl synthase N-terminal-like domain-containing protein [Actinomycetota bacterium]